MSSPNLQILFPLLQHIFMYGKIISPTEEVIKMKKTIKRWTAGVLVAAITFSGPVMPAEAKGKLETGDKASDIRKCRQIEGFI